MILIGYGIFDLTSNDKFFPDQYLQTTDVNTVNPKQLPIITGQGSYMGLTFQQKVAGSPIVILGTVKSTETKIIDKSDYFSFAKFDNDQKYVGGTDPVWHNIQKPYLYVTLTVDEYLKDSTEIYADEITIRVEGTGEGIYYNNTRFYSYDDTEDYPIGEQAIYMTYYDDEVLSHSKHASKFYVSDDNTIQSNLRNEYIRSLKISDVQYEQITNGELLVLNGDQLTEKQLEWFPIPLEEAISKGKEIAESQRNKIQN
jgi:hypothetical protein